MRNPEAKYPGTSGLVRGRDPFALKPGTRCECQVAGCTGPHRPHGRPVCSHEAVRLVTVAYPNRYGQNWRKRQIALCAACAEYHESQSPDFEDDDICERCGCAGGDDLDPLETHRRDGRKARYHRSCYESQSR